MKKVIHGKKYNTETAKQLDYFQEGFISDFRYIREELYIKKTGEYFLHGSGGAASVYAVTTCGSSCAGAKITPFTELDAQSWAERNLTGEEYEIIFGEVGE